MGYFSNGTEGRMYEAEVCDKCIHYPHEDVGCPVMELHMLYNYEQHDNKDIANCLDTLIPRSKDGLSNEQCLMFHQDPSWVDPRQMRLFATAK